MRLLIPIFSPASGTWGGLTRTLAIGQAAARAGHQVAFAASELLAAEVRRHGYEVYPTPTAPLLGLPRPLARILGRRLQRAAPPIPPGRSVGNIWFVYLLFGMARATYLRRLVTAELQAAHAFRADALVTDLDPGAVLLARITGLPLALTYQAVMRQGVGSLAWRRMRTAEAAVLKEYGVAPLDPELLHFGPQVLKVVPSIPELDGSAWDRPDVRYVGHLLAPIQPAAEEEFRPVPGRRYVFVYMGTGTLALRALKEMLPRVFPSSENVTCLVGTPTVPQPERIGGVEFRPYVPAEAVLTFCDWTICHGGQNTIIQSLRHGVPLLVFPGPMFERRFNAAMVQAVGTGLMGETHQFTPEWLRSALERHAEFAPRAAALGERIRSYGGPCEAVQAIEELLQVSRESRGVGTPHHL